MDFLKKRYEEYSEKRVLMVAVPIPPVEASGLIFRPQAYASKSYDRWDFRRRDEDFKIITVMFSDVLGPVVLVSTQVKHLIRPENLREVCQGEFSFEVQRSTYCASVSFHKMELFGTAYADEVVVDDLTPITRSCHPGSHYIVPRAPSLTALLQYTQAPTFEENQETRTNALMGFEYLNPEQGELFFPGVDWNCNAIVEEEISHWPFDRVSYSRLSNGPGEWAREYLNKLRRNKFFIKEREGGEISDGNSSELRSGICTLEAFSNGG